MTQKDATTCPRHVIISCLSHGLIRIKIGDVLFDRYQKLFFELSPVVNADRSVVEIKWGIYRFLQRFGRSH